MTTEDKLPRRTGQTQATRRDKMGSRTGHVMCNYGSFHSTCRATFVPYDVIRLGTQLTVNTKGRTQKQWRRKEKAPRVAMRLKKHRMRGFTLEFQTSYLQKTLEGLAGKNTIPHFMGLKTISELTVEKYLV